MDGDAPVNGEEQLGTERDNRTEHREDQRDYQRDRLKDKDARIDKATVLEEERDARERDVEEARVVREDALRQVVEEKERTHRRIAFWQLVAFLAIVTISAVGWKQIEAKSAQIEHEAEQRCQAGENNRQALRNLVNGVDDLGTALVTSGKTPTTPEQDAALAEFDTFRKNQLALLAGPVCPEK